MANTIKIYSRYGKHVEGLASGTPTPGHLLERTSAVADTLKVHASVGGKAQRIFAIEDELQGAVISTAYTAGEKLFALQCLPGDQVNALIADGENIAKSDELVSAGDGTLQKANVDSASTVIEQDVVAIAMAACDMSGSSGADSPRCVVEIV